MPIYQILEAGTFGAFGFILGFFMRRAINIILFGIFTYAIFECLHRIGVPTDWKEFYRFVTLMSELGRTLLHLVQSMLRGTGIVALFLFIGGGIAGLALKRRGT
ncbi:MAG: hypothetical protein A4E65_01560 [Syntrophorhabdus sp. PtaU1.Bin153]|nr:MAG: hypothetical protein A4E65_01560 [Syntrophorhabdus sp. PtaU1.Bin153]